MHALAGETGRHAFAFEIGDGLDRGILGHEEYRIERGEHGDDAQIGLRLVFVDHLAGDGVMRLQFIGETELLLAGS